MNLDRNGIISQLEKTRTYVNAPELFIADSEKQNLNQSLDNCVRYARYGRYHVTTLGVFSSGKSTLINSLLENRILPAADLPVTAITTEIYHSDQTSIFIPMEKVSNEIITSFRNGLSSFFTEDKGEFVCSLNRDGEKFSGIGAISYSQDNKLIYSIIEELTSQQKRKQEPFLALKDILDSNHDLVLWIGLSKIPEWLKDIVLTDAPGTGSIDDSHEIIINKVIPESQLVLYLIESTKAGSAIDKSFCDRISNTYHRKIFYILNKIDQQNKDEQDDALDCAKRCVPEVSQDGTAPEFLKVSGLYALMATELRSNLISVENVVCDPKINLNLLLVDPKWAKADENEKNKLLADFLFERSLFHSLTSRIEEYLKYENKELAIIQQSYVTIFGIAKSILQNCNKSILVLNSDRTLEELQNKKDRAHQVRTEYSHEADTIIGDFLTSTLDSDVGICATINGLLSPIPNKI